VINQTFVRHGLAVELLNFHRTIIGVKTIKTDSAWRTASWTEAVYSSAAQTFKAAGSTLPNPIPAAMASANPDRHDSVQKGGNRGAGCCSCHFIA